MSYWDRRLEQEKEALARARYRYGENVNPSYPASAGSQLWIRTPPDDRYNWKISQPMDHVTTTGTEFNGQTEEQFWYPLDRAGAMKRIPHAPRLAVMLARGEPLEMSKELVHDAFLVTCGEWDGVFPFDEMQRYEKRYGLDPKRALHPGNIAHVLEVMEAGSPIDWGSERKRVYDPDVGISSRKERFDSLIPRGVFVDDYLLTQKIPLRKADHSSAPVRWLRGQIDEITHIGQSHLTMS